MEETTTETETETQPMKNNGSPGLWGVRHWQCFLYFLGMTIAYANDNCLSAVMDAMIDEQKTTNGSSPTYSTNRIASSFWWGYAVMQIPSGYLAMIGSVKLVLAIGIFLSGLTGILSPLVFDQGGWMYLRGCRIIMGLCQACLLPCIHTLLSRWVPPKERGRLGTMTYAGSISGIAISILLAEALISVAGWRSVVYLFGAAAIIWSSIFFFLGSNSPSASIDKRFLGITEAEKDYIEGSFENLEEGDADNGKKKVETPWRAILGSRPFWALLISHCAFNWGVFMLVPEMQQYLAEVHKFNISQNRLITVLPFVVMLILMFPLGWLSDWCEKKGMSRGLLRKTCNTIGQWGPGFALIGMCYMPIEETTLAVVLWIMIGGLAGSAMCGFQINHMDLSTKYAGLLMAFTNTFASIVDVVALIIVGEIVPDASSASQWRVLFALSALIYFLASLIFIVFGSGETLWWDRGAQWRMLHPA